MQLKTVSSIGLAFLLVVGMVGVASAQEVAATQGILIRVDAPKANEWVAIGDTIRIRVLCYDGILDDGFRVAVVDSGVADEFIDGDAHETDIGGQRTGVARNLAEKVFYHIYYLPAANAILEGDGHSSVVKGDGFKSGIDTFKVKFGVAAIAGLESASNHALKVVLALDDMDDETIDPDPLNNLMSNRKISRFNTGFGATHVGDGKLFGVDGVRPQHAGIIKSIKWDVSKLATIDVEAINVLTTVNDTFVHQIRIATDDEFTTVLTLDLNLILRNDIDKIEVGLVPVDSINALLPVPEVPQAATDAEREAARVGAFKDAAVVKYTLREDGLSLREQSHSMIIEAGQIPDNQRLELFAYPADVAGNVAGDATGPIAADWRSLHGTDDSFIALFEAIVAGQVVIDGETDIPIVGDATAPTIDVRYPNPDSMAAESHKPLITAALMQTLSNYKRLPGEAAGVQASRKLNPLNIRFSETPGKITIKHADSTLTLLGDNDVAPTGGDSTAMVDFLNDTPEDNGWYTVDDETGVVAGIADGKYVAKGGTSGDIIITVWDSLDNSSTLTLEGITLDGNTPRITNLFPTATSAPKDAENEEAPSVNLKTKNPAFEINEDLDSLSIRYHEAGGGPAIVQAYSRGNFRLETVGSLVTWPVNDTTFVERQRYDLEVLALDLAGNASVTRGGQLTFTKDFGNPNADIFKVVPDTAREEKQVAGVDYDVRLSVLDTTLSAIGEEDVRAVTYHASSAVAAIVSGDQADALEGLTFSGTGVTDAPAFTLPAPLAAAGMVAKAAILDGDGWHAGQRDIKFKSTKPLTNVILMAAEGTIDPATGAYALRISGQAAKPINIEIAEFSKFILTAIEGEISADNVAGVFDVRVVPTDAFANPSLRIENSPGAKDYASVAFTFASSNAAVLVPSGHQIVTSIDGSTFGAVASDVSGSATISVRTVVDTYTTGAEQGKDADKSGAVTGAVTVSIVSDDGDGPDPGAPAAVANVVVQDYLGADGSGDQGGIVMISFPNSSQHDAVSHYQISREIDSTTGLDDEGNVVELEEPVKVWMPWTSVSFAADAGDAIGNAEGDMQNVIVPALDNVATNWGVTAVSGAGSSDQTTASKRVFTKESVEQTLQLLGMAPEAVLTDDELMNQFNAPEDYVKSLIGDQKNVIFAPVNPDVSALMGSASVPANIRTAGHISAGSFLSSARTVTEEPVAAVDNIAPAAVTDASGDGTGGVVLQWTASANDGVVGSMPYRGYNVQILGVKGYKVLRGTSADDLEEIASIDPGSTQFTDDNVPDGAGSLVYRIDAYDDNNVAMGQLITVDNISVRMSFVDANGDPVYLMVLPSQGGDMEVNFEDFVAFAAAFNSQKGDANYNPQADVNDDGAVDFSDFVTAAASFGRTAAVPAGSKLAIAPQRPGVNADTEMTLELAGEKLLVGEEISVTVSMANAKQLNGFGLELTYDADKFEFVSAVPAEDDLLKSQGGETPLFKNWPEEGRVSVVNAIIDAGSVSGEGALVTFTFKVLREFEDNARFEIAQGVVFDADQLQNPVVSLGALDVQSTPTEFALHQNFPNPFNPQTNIPYDLAESGDVVLRIYNLLGQEVRTLVRERQPAGRYEVQWIGVDDRGVTVSSGIYFYQVSVAGKFQDAKRLMLLK